MHEINVQLGLFFDDIKIAPKQEYDKNMNTIRRYFQNKIIILKEKIE